MDFDIKAVLTALDRGLLLAKDLAPIVPGLGSLAPAAAIAAAVIEIGKNALARIEEGKIVATSEDQDQIKGLILRLQDVNDDYARQIAES